MNDKKQIVVEVQVRKDVDLSADARRRMRERIDRYMAREFSDYEVIDIRYTDIGVSPCTMAVYAGIMPAERLTMDEGRRWRDTVEYHRYGNTMEEKAEDLELGLIDDLSGLTFVWFAHEWVTGLVLDETEGVIDKGMEEWMSGREEYTQYFTAEERPAGAFSDLGSAVVEVVEEQVERGSLPHLYDAEIFACKIRGIIKEAEKKMAKAKEWEELKGAS